MEAGRPRRSGAFPNRPPYEFDALSRFTSLLRYVLFDVLAQAGVLLLLGAAGVLVVLDEVVVDVPVALLLYLPGCAAATAAHDPPYCPGRRARNSR